MKNYVKPGRSMTVVATEAVTSGQGYFVGKTFGVIQGDAAIGERFELLLEGVCDLPSDTAITASQGDKAYWPDSGSGVTDSTSSTTQIGHFEQAKGAGSLIARVRLNQQ